MNEAFAIGLEKRSYEYAHERRELEQHYTARQNDKPMDKRKATLLGAGIGAGVAGAMTLGVGLAKRRLGGVLLGATLGAGAGAGLGALTAIADKRGIQEAKRIMAMPEKERSDYLHHLVREGEISEQEAREWARTHAMTMAVAAASRPSEVYVIGSTPSTVGQLRVPTGNCQNCGSPGVHRSSMGWACDHCGSNR